MKQAVKKAVTLLLVTALAVGTLCQGTAAEAKEKHKFIQDKPKPEKGGIGDIGTRECFLMVETPNGEREISTGMDSFRPILLNQKKSAYAYINLPDYSKAVSSSLKSGNNKVFKVVNKKQGKIKALKLGTAKLTAKVRWKYTGKPRTISYPVLKKLSKNKAKKYDGATHLVKSGKLNVKKGKTYTFKLTLAVTVICKKHTYGAWKTTKKATCSAEGEKQRKCKKCGIVDTKWLENLPHTYGEWKVTKPATSEEKGEKTRVCTVCGEEDVEDIDKLPEGSATPAVSPSLPPEVSPSQPPAGNPSQPPAVSPSQPPAGNPSQPPAVSPSPTPDGGSAANPPAPSDNGGTSAPAKEAGLYDADGKLVESWEELIENRTISVDSEGYLIDCDYNISGNLVIENSVSNITPFTFSECGLTCVTIPDSVTSIGTDAFLGVSLVIYDGNAADYSEWGADKVQKSDGTQLYPVVENE